MRYQEAARRCGPHHAAVTGEVHRDHIASLCPPHQFLKGRDDAVMRCATSGQYLYIALRNGATLRVTKDFSNRFRVIDRHRQIAAYANRERVRIAEGSGHAHPLLRPAPAWNPVLDALAPVSACRLTCVFAP